MKRKVIYAVIGVFVLGIIGSVAFVKYAEGQRAKRRSGMRGLAALELTDEQKKKMDELRSAHQKAMIDLRAAYQKARIDLQVVRKQDNPSASDIQAKIDAVMAAQSKMMGREMQRGLEIRNILTDEQKEKLDEMRRGGRKGVRGPSFKGRGPDFKSRSGFRGRRGGDHGRMKKESKTKEKSKKKKKSEHEDSSEM